MMKKFKLFPPEITRVSEWIYLAADIRVIQLLDVLKLSNRYSTRLNSVDGGSQQGSTVHLGWQWGARLWLGPLFFSCGSAG